MDSEISVTTILMKMVRKKMSVELDARSGRTSCERDTVFTKEPQRKLRSDRFQKILIIIVKYLSVYFRNSE